MQRRQRLRHLFDEVEHERRLVAFGQQVGKPPSRHMRGHQHEPLDAGQRLHAADNAERTIAHAADLVDPLAHSLDEGRGFTELALEPQQLNLRSAAAVNGHETLAESVGQARCRGTRGRLRRVRAARGGVGNGCRSHKGRWRPQCRIRSKSRKRELPCKSGNHFGPTDCSPDPNHTFVSTHLEAVSASGQEPGAGVLNSESPGTAARSRKPLSVRRTLRSDSRPRCARSSAIRRGSPKGDASTTGSRRRSGSMAGCASSTCRAIKV